ncbi:MAG: hypothetical protein NW237_11410 [Cyanobacteriota bacterium]|nr:hypothetical protein [Cyanobacteriota bacterium]
MGLTLTLLGGAGQVSAESVMQSGSPSAPSWGIQPSPPTMTPAPTLARQVEFYQGVIEQTRGMVENPQAQQWAQAFGLNLMNVTWEDTGRYHGSAVGPNISDMTIQVQHQDPRTGAYSLSLMPVIRHPNFSDLSADVPLDRFYLLVGNQKGQPLQRVSLRDFLGNLPAFLSQPESWQGSRRSLLAGRDSHVLVSAQAAFLPIPQQGSAQFNPVLFNYQSRAGDPAVLTILATREGSSVTVIDNQRDGFQAGATWGQRLFFNQNGERASLTGRRMSDFQGEGGERGDPQSDQDGVGLNMVMLIQVPLKQKHPWGNEMLSAPAVPQAAMESAAKMSASDVEAAVIGHGEVEGPFTEIDNLDIERDPAFPIRVTVQFYKATSNGVMTRQDMEEIHQEISRVYDDADYVGSLVLDGAQGRATEWNGDKQQPAHWWQQFWQGQD